MIVFTQVLLFGIFSGCDRKSEETQIFSGVPVYHFVVYPLHNFVKLEQIYQPLIDYQDSCLQVAYLNPGSSWDYDDLKIKSGKDRGQDA